MFLFVFIYICPNATVVIVAQWENNDFFHLSKLTVLNCCAQGGSRPVSLLFHLVLQASTQYVGALSLFAGYGALDVVLPQDQSVFIV